MIKSLFVGWVCWLAVGFVAAAPVAGIGSEPLPDELELRIASAIEQAAADVYLARQPLVLESGAAGLIAETDVALLDRQQQAGEGLQTGNVIVAGFLVNLGTEDVILRPLSGNGSIVLEPGEAIGVLPASPEDAAVAGIFTKKCTCKCGSRFVAVDPWIWQCHVMNDRECITQFGGLAKFKSCKERYVELSTN